ncbi:glycoside hydrolase family 2 protein [Butyrivibrio sp. MC2013]|uniref:glycoside hydrolase family 2 protein n=1 Tax=Butyrivibrio sp. MC2013 TaxID=1280686 RepID=UPI0004020378|nr:sugar-binding domain-containing protein [Butyrivibrio sp. MC2013]
MRSIYLDRGWKFTREGLGPHDLLSDHARDIIKQYSDGVIVEDLDEKDWKNVTLPHDMLLEGEYTRSYIKDYGNRLFLSGSLEAVIGWYRKKFYLGGELEGKRFILHFDGAGREVRVYLNESFVCKSISRSGAFDVDVTDVIRTGEENVNILAVRVDSSEPDLPWYQGGGIYDHVRLEVLEQADIVDDDILVETVYEADADKAVINIDCPVSVSDGIDHDLEIDVSIMDHEGNSMASADSALSVGPASSSHCHLKLEMSSPVLWECDSPALYSAVLTLTDKMTDRKSVHVRNFGIRSMSYYQGRGNYLNFKPINITGVSIYRDHAGCGVAVPDSIKEFRLVRLKELGFNAIRFAGGAASRHDLELCDRLGFLVYNEIGFEANAEESAAELRKMIRISRNHPSVYCYGIRGLGSSLAELCSGMDHLRTLSSIAEKEDPQRLFAVGIKHNKDADIDWDGIEQLFTIADVISSLGDNDFTDRLCDRFPEAPVMLGCIETPAWVRNCWVCVQRKIDYRDAIRGLVEADRLIRRRAEHSLGFFLATAYDHRGDPQPLEYPAVLSQTGLLDACGYMKDVSWYWKSRLGSEPIAWLFPGWEDIEQLDKPVDIYAFSNLDTVELSSGRKSLGRIKVPESGIVKWEGVGEQEEPLHIRGWHKYKKLIDKTEDFSGSPFNIRIEPADDSIVIGDGDVIIMNLSLLDVNGNVSKSAEDWISLRVSGAGVFAGCGNGAPLDHDSDLNPHRKAFHGRMQFLIRVTGKGNLIKVSASTDKLRTECTITL